MGAYSIAYADDTCDEKEISVLEKTISALPAFAPFAGEIAQMSSNIHARYEASARSANAQALRELADVAGIDMNRKTAEEYRLAQQYGMSYRNYKTGSILAEQAG